MSVQKHKPVRVRYAPSPTGLLHLGGARTALFNWLFARHHGGAFILRVEDTDQKRYRPDALADTMSMLRWLGIDWDEGPEVGGPYGPYFQLQRAEIYRKYAQQLVSQGDAYYCFCSVARLAALRAEQERRHLPPGYDRHCRDLDPAQAAARARSGESCVIRFKMPLDGQTTLHDLIRGDITWENRLQEDFVILKSDGLPTYHLANVVDDTLMRISHIMRADEWIPSAPKHLQMYRAFGWEPPLYAHLPILLNPSGTGKMSKRKQAERKPWDEATLVRDFKEDGYLPEALVNFLALLGWAWDDRTELFTIDELIAKFDLDRVKPSPAALNYDKLEWMNGVYIRQLSAEDFVRRVRPFFEQAGYQVSDTVLLRLTPLIQGRIRTLREAVEKASFLFARQIKPDPAQLVGKGMTPQESLTALEQARAILAEIEPFEAEPMESALRVLAERLGLQAGQLFGILRVAVTGQTVAPPLFGMLALLGREETLARLNQAAVHLAQLAEAEAGA